MKYLEMNGRNFDPINAFPPIDEDVIQNALMIAPLNNEEDHNKLWLWGWGCYIDSDGVEFWSWEPLSPLDGAWGISNLIDVMRDKEGS